MVPIVPFMCPLRPSSSIICRRFHEWFNRNHAAVPHVATARWLSSSRPNGHVVCAFDH
jgi:hypothetical protein